MTLDNQQAFFEGREYQGKPDFWREPIGQALSEFFEKSSARFEDKKPFGFFDYHGNLASPFLGDYMLEAFREAFPEIQGAILKEAGIDDSKDIRKKLFDVARSHMERMAGSDNTIKPVLSYAEDLINLIRSFGLDMALLSSTSITTISENFDIFKNIEGQAIQAGLGNAFRAFSSPELKGVRHIKRNSFGFFMEKQDKAQGFEAIMKDLCLSSAVIMEDSRQNIDGIKAAAKRNGWNLLVIHNEESSRQARLLEQNKEDRDFWEATYASYLLACLGVLVELKEEKPLEQAQKNIEKAIKQMKAMEEQYQALLRKVEEQKRLLDAKRTDVQEKSKALDDKRAYLCTTKSKIDTAQQRRVATRKRTFSSQHSASSLFSPSSSFSPPPLSSSFQEHLRGRTTFQLHPIMFGCPEQSSFDTSKTSIP